MSNRYFIRTLDLPVQADALWGTDVDGDPSAALTVEAALHRVGLARCTMIEVAAVCGERIGLQPAEPEHVRAISAVHAGWFVFDRLKVTVTPVSAATVTLAPTTALIPSLPPGDALLGYPQAEKKHALNVRFGRPSTLPERPPLLDLFEGGRAGGRVEPVIRTLAAEGGVSYFRTSASRITLITWSNEPAQAWIERWKQCVPEPDAVVVTDDLPVD